MSQETIISNTEVSFKDFLFKNKRNRTILWIAAAAIVIQFAVFKYFYPFPNFIHGDSFSYLDAATENRSINTYPIGYSNFLRFISVFTKSDIALTAFQYIFLQLCIFSLLFTIFYFFKPSKALQTILLSFMLFNPLLLHLGNLISSDCYFLSLSLLWITLLIWIIYNSSYQIVLLHTLVLFLAFITRYNAILYPAISVGVFIFLTKSTWKQKVANVLPGIVLCASFIFFTAYQYKKLTGYWQYAPFSGWQIANNAMYAYRFVDSSKRKAVPKKFHALDKMVREFYDSTRDTNRFITESLLASTFYMWHHEMPLMKYRDRYFEHDTTMKELKKWASMGPLYKEYGTYIIMQYPVYYLRYFIWPNINKYYAPPVEFLETYNTGRDSVYAVAQHWFSYKTKYINTRFKDKAVWTLNYYPILSGMINVAMICSIICFVLLKGWKYNIRWNKLLVLGCSVWFLNAIFTIFASAAALRYQTFPILLTTIMVGMFIDWLCSTMEMLKKEDLKYENPEERLTREVAG